MRSGSPIRTSARVRAQHVLGASRIASREFAFAWHLDEWFWVGFCSKIRRSGLSNSFRASFRSLGGSARCLSSFRPFSFELAGVQMRAQKQARRLESQDALEGNSYRLKQLRPISSGPQWPACDGLLPLWRSGRMPTIGSTRSQPARKQGMQAVNSLRCIEDRCLD